MGRVLGRPKYKNWEDRLKEQIKLNQGRLQGFRTKDLTTTAPLDQYETSIRTCYEAFEKALRSPIATAKTLHLICPDFFPLWDNAITNAAKAELEDENNDSSGDYYEFMLCMQKFIRTHDQVFSELASRYNRRKLRILDEFLWWISHRPLSLFHA
jgi:hypothetical protein